MSAQRWSQGGGGGGGGGRAITDEPDLGDHNTFPGHFPTESSLFDFGARPELTALTLGGFASAAFARVLGAKSGGGVGDDAHSWAVDGARQLKRSNGEEPYTCTWQAGDFIGLACDLDAMRELSASSSSSPPTQDR
jgi:hypothetical protein